MKKVFLITALLALSSAAFTGCGTQMGRKSTQEESTVRQTEIQIEENTEDSGANDSLPDHGTDATLPDNGMGETLPNDGADNGTECPDCKPHKPHPELHGYGFGFIFHVPAPEFFKNCPCPERGEEPPFVPDDGNIADPDQPEPVQPEENGAAAQKSSSALAPEDGATRAKRPPRTRMPKTPKGDPDGEMPAPQEIPVS